MDWEEFYNNFRRPDFIPGYEIQNRLGGGAFGDVYKARKQSIGKAYAIKFLKVEGDSQREAVERELAQVRHMAVIDHPNLVTIEDMGSVLGVPYLIMGYAGEDTLARRLERGPLEPERALLHFVQVCRGVLALHDRRLVHFDLKPSNVFLRGEVARVGDYGLSKLLTDGRMTLSFGRGTPQYMAPEMLRSRADQRADLYSLGVILFECLTGELPFAAQEPGGLVLREEDIPPSFPPGFPARLEPVVARCLRLDPGDRQASVGELLEALGQTARLGDSIRIDWTEGASALSAVGRARPAAPAPGARPPVAAGTLTVDEGMAAARPPSAPAPGSRGLRARARERARGLLAAVAVGRGAVVDGREARSRAAAARAVATVPVPPRAEGGALGTFVASLVVGMEVLGALVGGLARGAMHSFAGAGDRLLRASGGSGRRAARWSLFLLGMALLGALVMGLGLVFVQMASV